MLLILIILCCVDQLHGMPFTSFYFCRWVLGFHSRNIITQQTLTYYGLDTQHKNHISNSELKLEALYEDLLVAEFTRNRLFEGRNPEKLTTFMNNDVASQAIEETVLEVFEQGQEGVRKFMLERLVNAEGEDQPSQAFSSRLPRNNHPMFLNLFDVVQSSGLTEKQVIQADRALFKCLITAQMAGRSVDFAEAARHEALSVPISIFKTVDKSMRDGTKSTLVDPMLKSAGVEKLKSLPPCPMNESHHAVDCMALVNSIEITEDIKTFKDFSDNFNKVVYRMPSSKISLDCDRYDKPSPKESTRKK